jgi:DedD protein
MPLSSLRFWRSKPAPPPAATAPRRAPRRAAAESAPRDPDTERARTRQRLLGAAVLLALGVLIFGLLFETEPRSSDALSAAQLARRDAGPVLGAPLSGAATEPEVVLDPAPATASEPAPGPVVEAAPAVPAAPAEAPAVAAAPPVTAPVPAPTSAAAPSPVPAAAPPPVSAAPPPAMSPSPPATAPRTAPSDGARARALLEGRPVAPAPVAPSAATPPPASPPTSPPAPAASPGTAVAARYVVQVGAYSSDNALRAARQRVERLGLKTYTQVVQTPQGARTRVRVGPFDDRAQAEAAAEKLRAAQLPAALLTL